MPSETVLSELLDFVEFVVGLSQGLHYNSGGPVSGEACEFELLDPFLERRKKIALLRYKKKKKEAAIDVKYSKKLIFRMTNS